MMKRERKRGNSIGEKIPGEKKKRIWVWDTAAKCPIKVIKAGKKRKTET